MVEKHYEVVWNTSARNQVREIYNYILQDSRQNAQKILGEIMTSTEKLAESNKPIPL